MEVEVRARGRPVPLDEGLDDLPEGRQLQEEDLDGVESVPFRREEKTARRRRLGGEGCPRNGHGGSADLASGPGLVEGPAAQRVRKAVEVEGGGGGQKIRRAAEGERNKDLAEIGACGTGCVTRARTARAATSPTAASPSSSLHVSRRARPRSASRPSAEPTVARSVASADVV